MFREFTRIIKIIKRTGFLCLFAKLSRTFKKPSSFHISGSYDTFKNKEIFYKTYKDSKLIFPKTIYYDCTKDTKLKKLTYPVILKPSNVVIYKLTIFICFIKYLFAC